MYVCMYVYVCMYIYIYIHTHTYIRRLLRAKAGDGDDTVTMARLHAMTQVAGLTTTTTVS